MLEKAGQVTSDMHMFFCFCRYLYFSYRSTYINTYLNSQLTQKASVSGSCCNLLQEDNIFWGDTKIFSTRLLNLRQFA